MTTLSEAVVEQSALDCSTQLGWSVTQPSFKNDPPEQARNDALRDIRLLRIMAGEIRVEDVEEK